MKTAVAALVRHNDSVLIGKKIPGKSFLAGKWHLPGGKMNDDETPIEAIIREIKEETGLDIEVIKLLGTVTDNINQFQVKWYLCTTDRDELNPGDDLSDAKFVPSEQVVKLCAKQAVDLWPEEIIKELANSLEKS